MAHSVFISYSSKNKQVADGVCAGLESSGHRCWMAPRDIRPGEDWPAAIINALKVSKFIVVVFSRHADASPQVLREVERAVNTDLIVIPFRIDSAVPSGSMEYFLSAPHWLDAMTPPLAARIEDLACAISSIMQSAGSPEGDNNIKHAAANAGLKPLSLAKAGEALSIDRWSLQKRTGLFAWLKRVLDIDA